MRADIGPVLGGLLLLVAGCAGVPGPTNAAARSVATEAGQRDVAAGRRA